MLKFANQQIMTFYFALFFCFGQEYSPLNLNTTLNNTSNLHSSVIFIIEMKTILLLQTQVSKLNLKRKRQLNTRAKRVKKTILIHYYERTIDKYILSVQQYVYQNIQLTNYQQEEGFLHATSQIAQIAIFITLCY